MNRFMGFAGRKFVSRVVAVLGAVFLIVGGLFGFSDKVGSGALAAGSVTVYNLNSYDSEALNADKHVIAEKYYALRNRCTALDSAGYFVSGSEATNSAPYYYGTLKQETLDCMIAYANFYRWLQGTKALPKCTNNDTLQAGAYLRVIARGHSITRNQVLSAVPDMDEDILDKGVGVYNNILAWGCTPYASISGWINEGQNNVIGHRWFVISPYVTNLYLAYSEFSGMSFGNCSLGRGSTTSKFDSDLPASVFPNAGYCPRAIYSSGGAAWSFEVDTSVIAAPTVANVTVTLTNLDTGAVTTRSGNEIHGSDGYGNIVYYNPPEGTNENCRFKVEITGLKTKAGGDASIVYTTELFDAAEFANTTVKSVRPADVYSVNISNSLSADVFDSIAGGFPKGLKVTCENGYTFTVDASTDWRYDAEAEKPEVYTSYSGKLPTYVTDPDGILSDIRVNVQKFSDFNLTITPDDLFPGTGGTMSVAMSYGENNIIIDKVNRTEDGKYTFIKKEDSLNDNCTVDNYYSTSNYYKKYAFSIDAYDGADTGDYIAHYRTGSTWYYSNIASLHVGESSINSVKLQNGVNTVYISQSEDSESYLDTVVKMLPKELTIGLVNGVTYDLVTESEWKIDTENECFYIDASDITLPQYVNDNDALLNRVEIPYQTAYLSALTLSGSDVFPGSTVTFTTANINNSTKDLALNKVTEDGFLKISDINSEICEAEEVDSYRTKYKFTLSDLAEEDSGSYYLSYIYSKILYVTAYKNLRVGETDVKSATLKGIRYVTVSSSEKNEKYLDSIATMLPDSNEVDLVYENGGKSTIELKGKWTADSENKCFVLDSYDVDLPQYVNDTNEVIKGVKINLSTSYISSPSVTAADVVPGSDITLSYSVNKNSYTGIELYKVTDDGIYKVADADSSMCTVTEGDYYNDYEFLLGDLKEEDTGDYFIAYYNNAKTSVYISAYRNIRVGETSIKSVSTVDNIDYIYTAYSNVTDDYLNAIASILPKDVNIICANNTEFRKTIEADWYYDKESTTFVLPLDEIKELPPYVNDDNNVLTKLTVLKYNTSSNTIMNVEPEICNDGDDVSFISTLSSVMEKPVLYRYEAGKAAEKMLDTDSSDYGVKDSETGSSKVHSFTIKNAVSTDEGYYFIASQRKYYSETDFYITGPKMIVFDIPASGVKLDQNEAEIGVDDSLRLTASVLPKNALNKNVSWASSYNSGLYSIYGNSATFYAYYPGEYTVTVTTEDGGYEDTCNVKVYGSQSVPNAPEKVSVTSDSVTLKEISYGEYSMDKETWQDSNVFTDLEPNTSYTFYVRKKAHDFYRASDISEGTVIKTLPVEVSSIKISCDTMELEKSRTLKLSAAILPENATDKTVTWSSSDDTIATVSEDGTVTGLKKGSVKITAESSNKLTDTIEISVLNIAVNVDFKLSTYEVIMNSGDGIETQEELNPYDASVKPVHEDSVLSADEEKITFSFESEDDSIANIISKEGETITFKALKPGQTRIKAVATAYDATETVKYCDVTVNWKLAKPEILESNIMFYDTGMTRVIGMVYDGNAGIDSKDHRFMYSIDGENYSESNEFMLPEDTEYTLYVKDVPTETGIYLSESEIGTFTFRTPETYENEMPDNRIVTDPVIELESDGFIYDGTGKTPSVRVYDGETLIPAEEYTVSYKNNLNAGSAKVIITDIKFGEYTVYGEIGFTIEKAKLTIKAKDLKIPSGSAPQNDGAQYTGFVGDETEADEGVLTGTLSFAYTYTEGDPDGEYEIIPKGVTAANYEITFENGKLTVGDPIWPFSDVAKGSTGSDLLKQAYDLGIVSGVTKPDENGQVKYKPEKAVTRAQFAIMVYNMARAEGLDLTIKESKTYNDIQEGGTGYNEIMWASGVGIIRGFDNGTFKPSREVTRAQIAIMLRKYAELTGRTINPGAGIDNFPDHDTVDPETQDALSWAVTNGILYGIKRQGITYIAPAQSATRLQCAMFVMRFYKLTNH